MLICVFNGFGNSKVNNANGVDVETDDGVGEQSQKSIHFCEPTCNVNQAYCFHLARGKSVDPFNTHFFFSSVNYGRRDVGWCLFGLTSSVEVRPINSVKEISCWLCAIIFFFSFVFAGHFLNNWKMMKAKVTGREAGLHCHASWTRTGLWRRPQFDGKSWQKLISPIQRNNLWMSTEW